MPPDSPRPGPRGALPISRSLLQRWKYLHQTGSAAAIASVEAVVPASALKAAEARIRELTRALGRKTMEVEILQAARDEGKKAALVRQVVGMTGHPVRAVCATLGIGRATAYRATQGRPARYRRAEDATVEVQLRAVLRDRASYGYRRARALVNQTYGTRYNRKRIQRVMALAGLTLPQRRRRSGRAHTGLVRRPYSNVRWCSDALLVACWNGDVVHLATVLDCADREVLAWVAALRPLGAADTQTLATAAVTARFGAHRPPRGLQWLSDNGSIYTAVETVWHLEDLGLTPITTPVASPESNGMAEAWVNTLRRDYLDGADLASGTAVLAQLPVWIEDYNTVAPHSALGYRPPLEARRQQEIH